MTAAPKPKAKVYRMDGTAVGELELDPKIFGVRVNQALVHQAVVTQQANARVAIAHTKTRGEVRGGGRKPWRQKGTGRARHGSIRSPIWVGGGVTFGPRSNRNYSKRMNAKARRLALLMSLTDKAQRGKLLVLESLDVPAIKTKTIAAMIKSLKLNSNVLTILPKQDAMVWKSARNIPNVTTAPAASLNVVDVLRHDTLLIAKPALETLSALAKAK